MRAISSYTQIANCVAWFDTLAGLSVSGGNTLTSWTDQSGVSAPATVAQAIANGLASAIGPTYTPSDPDFAGMPSLGWGTGETVLDAPLLAADLAAPLTFLMCGKFTGTQSASGRFMFTGPPGPAVTRRCNAGNPSTGFGLPTEIVITAGVGTLALNLIKTDSTMPFVASFSFDANQNVRTTAGRQIISRFRDPVLTALRTHSGWRFGRSGTNATVTAGWIGKFNALVAYNRFLTEGEIILASDLMMRRQGVTRPARTTKTRTALPVPGAVGGRTWIL